MIDSIIIRKANESDLEAILALIDSSKANNSKPMQLHDANTIYQSMLDDSNYFQIIASTEQAIVGVITLVIIMQMTHEGASTAFINDLIISNTIEDTIEKKTIANDLLKYTTHLAQEYGCHKAIIQSDYQYELVEEICLQLGLKKNTHSFELE